MEDNELLCGDTSDVIDVETVEGMSSPLKCIPADHGHQSIPSSSCSMNPLLMPRLLRPMTYSAVGHSPFSRALQR
jgi:hypothetical protein